MLDIQITGEFPQINTDLSGAMERAMEIMLASVQLNLLSGGRPPFNVKSESVDHTPLNASGKMYRGVMGVSDAKSATVYMDSSVVSGKGVFYPQKLNDGFEVPPFGTQKETAFNVPLNMLKKGKGVKKKEFNTPKNMLRNVVMVFEINGHTIFCTTRKGYHVGQFPFMIFQEQDMVRILELLPDAIFRTQGEIS